MTEVSLLVLTWLVASLPFGLVLSTLYGGDVDLRESGSGNIGATNVARVHGWSLAGPALALDVAKGLVPVVGARVLFPEHGPWFPGLVALLAFASHCASVFLEFRGGKGVATAAGAILALSPWVGLGAGVGWATTLAASGRSSVSALVAASLAVVLALVLDPRVLPVVLLFGVGIFATHTPNLRRLVQGEEKPIVAPVRWSRGTPAPEAETALEQGPAGVGPAPSLWPERPPPDAT